jgi:hypothetical protein
MNKALLAITGCMLIIASCKKDDSSTPSTPSMGSSLRIAIPPPAGFIFPYTYYQKGKSEEFKIQVNGVDVSSQYSAAQVFGSEDIFNVFNVVLRDKSNAELADPSGETGPISTGYFFANDTLFLITNTVIGMDTIALAKGNYSGFTAYASRFLVSTRQGPSPGFSFRSFDFSAMNFRKLNAIALDNGIRNPDTLAYYNQAIIFR